MPTVHVENREGVALLILDDPERRNALSVELCAAIVAAVESSRPTSRSALSW